MSLVQCKCEESVPSEIPRWEALPWSSLALEWAEVGAPWEQWGSWLKEAAPLDVFKCVQKLHMEKEKNSWVWADKDGFVKGTLETAPSEGTMIAGMLPRGTREGFNLELRCMCASEILI